MMSSRIQADLAFLFIGGEHQVLHLAPVAAEISRSRPDLRVCCVCADDRSYATLVDVAQAMHAPSLAIIQTAVPAFGQMLASLTRRQSAVKGPLLAKVRWQLRDVRAVIVPERTSALLRYMGWRRPLLHFRHGAGDRAPSSEARLAAFDRVFVPGPKDIERAIGQGVKAERLAAIGYVKLDYLSALRQNDPDLFQNSRPVVLYNPHFDSAISSLGLARDVIEQFRAQRRYNLIFAPHIRAFENSSTEERAEWQALAVSDQVIIDLDSSRLTDMTYARAADLYLGDMSSQLYEFLVEPRPAVFLNAHRTDWQGDARYAGWTLGEVVDSVEDILSAADRAFSDHRLVLAAQREAIQDAFGHYKGSISRAAVALLRSINL